MRDYDSAVSVALTALVAEATENGAEYVGKLEYALYRFADTLSEARKHMLCDHVQHCMVCNREWSIRIPVSRAREIGNGDYCPPCWNAQRNVGKFPEPSAWTNVFKYI